MAVPPPHFPAISGDKELEFKCRRFTERLSESLHLLSNDPSLALYRIQEHVRKSLPQLVQKRVDAGKLQQGIHGACFDLENAIQVMQGMKTAMPHFQNIYELLRGAMYYKQQLDYEHVRRERSRQVERSMSKDSIAQELRKTKSMGFLGSKSDLMSESVASRSTVSTPCSEYPDLQVLEDDLIDREEILDENDDDGGLTIGSLVKRRGTLTGEEELDEENRSSTTSGADSHVSDQDAFDEIEQKIHDANLGHVTNLESHGVQQTSKVPGRQKSKS